jgi:hypothetical protein
MRYYIGLSLQIAALVFLPLLVVWELVVRFRLIYMPGLLIVAAVVFAIGTKLRG